MAITLADGTTTITLHPDLRWSDYAEWFPVSQSVTRSVTGALIIQPRAITAGRDITLEPSDDSAAWMTSEVVEQLRNFAAVPGKVMTLTIGSDSYSVIFKHHQGTPVEAEPVAHYRTYIDTDFFIVTIKLMTV